MGGVLPSSSNQAGPSPRKRGIKQGLFIFLLTFLVVPIVAMLSQFVGLRPTLAGVAAVALFMGGILRMIYALMFEESAPQVRSNMPTGIEGGNRPQASLLPQPAHNADQWRQPATGNWRDTNDLQPTSVTEGTTRLLEKNDHADH